MSAALYALLGVALGALIAPFVVFVIALAAEDVAEGTVLGTDDWRGKERR